MNAKVKITYKDKDGNIIVDPKEGDIAMSPETKKLYTYKDGQWEIIKGETSLGVTMYDLNKQIISQMPVLDEGALDIARSQIIQFIERSCNEYYMILCRELNYYTLFKLTLNSNSLPYVMNEIIECANYLGDIKSIEWEEDKGAIEIWITQRENEKDTFVMYLFPYDAGVIECTL